MTNVIARVRGSAMFAIVSSVATSLLATVLMSAACAQATPVTSASTWSAEERAMLRSLSLSSLEPLAPDPSNKYGDDSLAATLGHALFFDTRLSANGKVSCASCHAPEKDFQDGTPLAHGVGTTGRRTMPVAGTAHSPWQFWDGRADSQWEQALGPLESAVEHGGTRTQYAHIVAEHYRNEYETVFGAMPRTADLARVAGPSGDSMARSEWSAMSAVRRDDISRVYANIGKAIAAYERRIAFASSRFDHYVDEELAGQTHSASGALTTDEVSGLRLFIGKANCANCHNGALLTDNHFHNTGVPAAAGTSLDSGRATGVRQAITGEFSCTSKYSDAKADDCQELRYAVTEGQGLVRAFKTPSLRNVSRRAPFMHAGQFATLTEVIAHYDAAPAAPVGHSELKPLHLSKQERRQIEAFLETIASPLSAPAGYLRAPERAR